jgi:hypothetical protein
MPSARECESISDFVSNKIDRTPWRARPNARDKPTGPPPAMRTGVSFMRLIRQMRERSTIPTSSVPFKRVFGNPPNLWSVRPTVVAAELPGHRGCAANALGLIKEDTAFFDEQVRSVHGRRAPGECWDACATRFPRLSTARHLRLVVPASRPRTTLLKTCGWDRSCPGL